jgi:acetyltransferase-like isoleucine patch superfamily enzyme
MKNISKKAKLGKNVSIGYCSKILDNVVIEDNVTIGDYCLIGFSNNGRSKKLLIKKGVKINSHSIIYNNSTIGKDSIIGHRVLVREKTSIENNVQIGSFSDIEGSCKILSYAKLHSNVHVGQHSLIMDYAWLFPYVILTNDPIPPSYIRKGVIVEPFAIVCTRSTVLPGKKIGFGSFVGANSLVNTDLKPEMIGSGNPFLIRGNIDRLKIPKSKKKAYPWIDRFQKDYPKNATQIYLKYKKKFL